MQYQHSGGTRSLGAVQDQEFSIAPASTHDIACKPLPCVFAPLGLLPRKREHGGTSLIPGEVRAAILRAARRLGWESLFQPSPGCAQGRQALRGLLARPGRGHSVGCHADNARPEPKRTSLILFGRLATVRSLDDSGPCLSRAVFPSTECVSQTSGVPQSPATFRRRLCSWPVHPSRCLHNARRYALKLLTVVMEVLFRISV